MTGSASTLFEHGYLWAFVSVFVGGFLTSLTPCVYPLIPITVSLFGARGANVSRWHALGHASCYVGGIGAMYAGLGIFSALFGRAFGTHMASPWIMVPIAVLFIAMSASMFGAFEIALPPSLQARLSAVGGKSASGAFAMGLVGGIIAAPCTGPVLASVLAYVATTRSVLLGSTLLFTYALGMGVLFFAIAIFAIGLPKSGGWMETVKSIFGVVMLVAALYFLRNVSPALAHYGEHTRRFLAIHLALATFGIGIGGIHLSFHDGWSVRIRKGLGVALAVVGIFGGVAWLLAEPAHDATASPALIWHKSEPATLSDAKAKQRPAMLDFYADWCLPCKELDLKTFHSPEVARELARFSLGKIDCTSDEDPEVVKLQGQYQADTLPTVVILDSAGKVVHKVNRFMEPEEFLPLLRSVK